MKTLAALEPGGFARTGAIPAAVAIPMATTTAMPPIAATTTTTASCGFGVCATERRSAVTVNELMNRAPFDVIGRGQQIDRRAFGSGATGAPYAMDIILRTLRQVEIDDVFDMRNVEATRRDIGRHQNPVFLVAKLLDNAIALALRQIAVNGARRIGQLER